MSSAYTDDQRSSIICCTNNRNRKTNGVVPRLSFPITIQFTDDSSMMVVYHPEHLPSGRGFKVISTTNHEDELETVNKGHLFEVVDRLSVAMHTFDDFVAQHPSVTQFPELALYARVVIEYMMRMYQISANLSFEWDEPKNVNKTFLEMLECPENIGMIAQQDQLTTDAITLSLTEAELLQKILASEVLERSCRVEVVALRDRIAQYKKMMEIQ